MIRNWNVNRRYCAPERRRWRLTINIAFGATLNFINPAPNGTAIFLKSQGNVTIAGTIDVSGMGAEGGSGGPAVVIPPGSFSGFDGNGGSYGAMSDFIADDIAHEGSPGQGSLNSGADTTPGPLASAYLNHYLYSNTVEKLSRKNYFLSPGNGGGGGGGGGCDLTGIGGYTTAGGGDGGRGGGALLIECAGALDFSGSIIYSGLNGANATPGTIPVVTPGGGGGGGGSEGMAFLIYATLAANSGSFVGGGGNGGDGNNNNATGGSANASGGAAGSGGGAFGASGAGGKGASSNGVNGVSAPANSGAGGGGGGGAGCNPSNNTGGTHGNGGTSSPFSNAVLQYTNI